MRRLQRDLIHLQELEQELLEELEEVKALETEIEQKIEEAEETESVCTTDNPELTADQKLAANPYANLGGSQRKYGHIGNIFPRSKEHPFELLMTNDKSLNGLNLGAAPNFVNLVADKPFFKIGGQQEPYDQGNLGSCTANALAFCFAYSAYKQDPIEFKNTFMPSRLDIYYQERLHMGKSYVKIDSGANISDCEYVLEKIGVIPENYWMYYDNARDKNYHTMPSTASKIKRIKMNTSQMYSVKQSEAAIKRALNADFPVIFGMGVFDSFTTATVAYTGIVPMPNLETESLLGGHAIVIVGYTEDNYFIVRNSWGVNWGLGFKSGSTYNFDEYGGKMRGYFKIPIAYVVNPRLAMAKSFYVVQNLSNTASTIKTYSTSKVTPTYDPRCARQTYKCPVPTIMPPPA